MNKNTKFEISTFCDFFSGNLGLVVHRLIHDHPREIRIHYLEFMSRPSLRPRAEPSAPSPETPRPSSLTPKRRRRKESVQPPINTAISNCWWVRRKKCVQFRLVVALRKLKRIQPLYDCEQSRCWPHLRGLQLLRASQLPTITSWPTITISVVNRSACDVPTAARLSRLRRSVWRREFRTQQRRITTSSAFFTTLFFWQIHFLIFCNYFIVGGR